MHKGIELIGFTSYLFTFQYAEAYLSRDILLVFLVWDWFFFFTFKISDICQSKGEETLCNNSTSREVDNNHYFLSLLPFNYWKKNLSHKTSLHLICVQVHCHTEVWSLTASLKLFVVFQSTSVITDMTLHSFMSVLRIFCMFKKKS